MCRPDAGVHRIPLRGCPGVPAAEAGGVGHQGGQDHQHQHARCCGHFAGSLKRLIFFYLE